jgi:HD-like signal output (HDOD) protein
MFSFFKSKDPHARLHEILGNYELPKFRKTVFETLRRLREPTATSADIAEVMSMDPDLTSRVMRTVNSTAYAPRTPIKDLDHAVTMLGKAELERIVMMLGAKMAVPKNVPSYVDMGSFWQRAGLRAVIARGLADLVAPAKAGLCFSAGFLQDFSVPLIAASKGSEYAKVYEASAVGDKPLHELEQEQFGWDHAELGALVCNEWEMPEDIAAAISTQNEPESELRPDPVFYVSDLPDEDDDSWRERFKEQVLTHHDVSEEALDKMLDEADGKARELVRLIS